MLSLWSPWNDFFHARLGSDGCRLCGMIRIAFAVLVIVDKLLLTLDLDFFFSPTNGVVPRRIGKYTLEADINPTLFDLAPESDLFLWGMHWMGMVHAVLLLLGIAPRFQMVALYANILSFHYHSYMIWDAEDNMLRMWCFLLVFFPLHRCTIYDLVGAEKKNWEKDSWPMWPIRLFQLEVTYVYLGASISKLPGGAWIDGTAMYYIVHTNDFYPGIFNPDVMFDRMISLKIMTWVGITAEFLSWIVVWIPSLRIAAVIVMVNFHLALEIHMNMHIFEWLAILGWIVFLLQPEKKKNESRQKTPSASSRISVSRLLKDVFIFVVAVVFFIDTLPLQALEDQAPVSHKPQMRRLMKYHDAFYRRFDVYRLLSLAGLYQGPWSMYTGDPEADNRVFEAYLTFDDGSRAVWTHPDWYEVGNFERKRYTRQLNYYANLPSVSVRDLTSLCVRLSRDYSEQHDKKVDYCELIYHGEDVVPPPPNLGWFEPAKQPMVKGRPKTMVLVRRGCYDYNNMCKKLAGDGICEDDPDFMKRNCQRSCGWCMGGYHAFWPNRQPRRPREMYYDDDGEGDDDDEGEDEGRDTRRVVKDGRVAEGVAIKGGEKVKHAKKVKVVKAAATTKVKAAVAKDEEEEDEEL